MPSFNEGIEEISHVAMRERRRRKRGLGYIGENFRHVTTKVEPIVFLQVA